MNPIAQLFRWLESTLQHLFGRKPMNRFTISFTPPTALVKVTPEVPLEKEILLEGMTGFYATEPLPNGEYTLEVSAPGYSTWTQKITLDGSDKVKALEANLAPTSISTPAPAPAPTPIPAPIPAHTTGTLRIKRPAGYYIALVPNGGSWFTEADVTTISDLQPGDYAVQVGPQSTYAEPVHFHLNAGDIQYFDFTSNTTPAPTPTPPVVPLPTPPIAPVPAPKPTPLPQNSKGIVVLDERDDVMIHTSRVTQPEIDRANAGPWDAITIFVDGYSDNWSGSAGLRSPRSGLVDKSALLAEMSKVDSISKPKIFFYMCDYFHIEFTGDPGDTTNPQREISLANMETVAACIAEKGWLGYIEDNEQYKHDGKPLEPQNFPGMSTGLESWAQQGDGSWNYWDMSYGRQYRNKMGSAIAYFTEMFRRMFTKAPNLQVAAYHGPYAGITQTPAGVVEGQIGYGFPGMTAWYVSALTTIVDLGLVGKAKVHSLGEAYGLPSYAEKKASIDYRIQQTPSDVVNAGWLGVSYQPFWAQVIDEGFMRGLYNPATPDQVRADLADAVALATGWVGVYPEQFSILNATAGQPLDYLAGWKQLRGLA